MAILHNQLVRLWDNPSYKKFLECRLARRIYKKKDWELFCKIGAYFVTEGLQHSSQSIPFDNSHRYFFFISGVKPLFLIGLGSEYFLKGLLLKNSIPINPTKNGKVVTCFYGNTKLLDDSRTIQFDKLKRIVTKEFDFSQFDIDQSRKHRLLLISLGGEKLKGIPRLTYRNPTAFGLLEYLHFIRNRTLHTPTTFPSFRGIDIDIRKFFNYISHEFLRRDFHKLATENF